EDPAPMGSAGETICSAPPIVRRSRNGPYALGRHGHDRCVRALGLREPDRGYRSDRLRRAVAEPVAPLLARCRLVRLGGSARGGVAAARSTLPPSLRCHRAWTCPAPRRRRPFP